jgi:Carboxypeptidase regulatory-like domain
MGRRGLTRVGGAAVIAITLAACSKPVVSGRVMDAFGKPLEDVVVSIEGTSFATTTDHSGGYDIAFVPGQFKVHLKKDGYTSVTNSLNVAQATKVPAADVGGRLSVPYSSLKQLTSTGDGAVTLELVAENVNVRIDRGREASSGQEFR